MGSYAAPTKPAHIAIGGLPLISHITPLLNIAQHLVHRGWDVSFISTESFRHKIEEIGATLVPIPGWESFDDAALWGFLKNGCDPLLTETSTLVDKFWILFALGILPASHAALQSILATHSDTPVVVLNDPLLYVATPSQLGAPGLKPAGVISIGIIPLQMHSIDTTPPWQGSVLNCSEEGRKRNVELNKIDLERLLPQRQRYHEILKELGATIETPHIPLNAVYALADIHLQLSPPSLEYPRSDGPADLRYTGGLPRRNASKIATDELPSWWDEVILNDEKKRIIAVSQGSVAHDYSGLVIPTLAGLGVRNDLLVVVALGKKGAVLPPSTAVPENARIADWIPFDDLLAHSDIFITNGGYGSFQNAIARGVPLVIAPIDFADKRDIAARVTWSGVGVNLGLGIPSGEKVLGAVNEVLRDSKYRENVNKVKDEIAGYDPIEVVETAVIDVVRIE
ncbi:MGT family glycosyltransferase [Bisporella sp. PMI_857]|nr:MGT family glycosyltransferase [Bisporella sp. PMI_857]